ncbi:polyketide cyclase [Dictyobacter vulcani]|uniref:Polyketide cyclase n=1 Tax=Dictyobacter vulcani TaxID=2607529 RepID=A0A5J4KH62_9CHLR|nr:SRPBCC family protein [Dictyobacter vulcani]GER88774.1 polyketide cyclase [Dictyobacter vulcani]
MSRVQAQKERIIDARPEEIYAILTDYKVQRPKLLTPNFVDYTVEKGGKGSGTVISYLLRAANRERNYRMRVDETVRGSTITESDANSSLTTTWALAPLDGGSRTRVRVTSEWDGATGVKGFFERTFAPLGLKRIYGGMLDALSSVLGVSDEEVTAVKGTEYKPGQNASLFLVVFAAVVGVAIAISYLQKSQNE